MGDTRDREPNCISTHPFAAFGSDLFGIASGFCVPKHEAGIFVTANLTVDYRSPLRTNTTFIVRVSDIELIGRKLRMKARVERAEDGKLIAEAKSLFIRATQWQTFMMQIAPYLSLLGLSF